MTSCFHSYFFRHDGAKRQYPLLCKYIIDLVRTAIKHERSPYRGRLSKVTLSRNSARTAGGVSNELACVTRLESLMRTCWLDCRDRERERENEAVTHLQAGARRRVRGGSEARTATAGGRAAGFTPARDHVPPRAEIYPANRSITRYLMVFPRVCVCVGETCGGVHVTLLPSVLPMSGGSSSSSNSSIAGTAGAVRVLVV